MRRLERKGEVAGLVGVRSPAFPPLSTRWRRPAPVSSRRCAPPPTIPPNWNGRKERLFAIRAAARKFSVQPDDLAALRERMAADLADLDAGEDRLSALAREASAARAAYDALAAKLSTSREAGWRGSWRRRSRANCPR